jgi:ABC-type branched-subunit amino acid transport system substrate-binding protein
LITEEGQGWILSADYLSKAGPDSGIKVVGNERFAPATADFRTIILRATRNKPQMVVLLSNPPYTETLIARLKESAPAQAFTGYFEIIDPKLVDEIPFPAQFEVETWFAKKFAEQFGNPPRSRAAQVYDIVHLVALATQTNGTPPSPEAIMSAVSNLPVGNGATGQLMTSAPRVVESRCVWKVAKNGEFQRYR